MTSGNRTLVAIIVAGVALLAAFWFAAIAPQRSDSTQVRGDLAAAQARLDTARTQVRTYTESRKQFDGLMTELRTFDKAVPARGAVASMLRELQRRAKVRGSALRIVALKDGAGPAPGTSAADATPGSVAGPGGLLALPFTFEYTGEYFDLVDILKTIRRSVRTKNGDLTITGRLLTVDGLAFAPVEGKAKLTKATVNATAYIAADTAAPPAADSTQKGGS